MHFSPVNVNFESPTSASPNRFFAQKDLKIIQPEEWDNDRF